MASRRIAWIALVAMLFSGISPALAGIVLRDKPDALGQMLGVAAAAAPEADVECAHEAASGQHHAPTPTGQHHGTHGVYCSLCLSPSATAALTIGPAVTPVLTLAFDFVPSERETNHVSALLTAYRSRAPPSAS